MNNALAVAGQTTANQVFNSTSWLVSVLPSVTATLLSAVYATGNRQKVKETVRQSYFLSALTGVPFTLYLLSKPDRALKSVFKSSTTPALEYAKAYFLIGSLAFIPNNISVLGYSVFRGALDTVTPLWISMF
jgi:Na+-driven multidrug efflux pump